MSANLTGGTTRSELRNLIRDLSERQGKTQDYPQYVLIIRLTTRNFTCDSKTALLRSYS